jgi:hypothetical protein
MINPSEIQLSFFRGGITNVDRPENVSLSWALDYIRQGKEYDPLIRSLRSETDQEKRQAIKKGLSYFCFSGTFSKRNAKSLIQHSGLMVLDFDHVKDLLFTRLQLQADPHCLALFISPSGDGIKMMILIDPKRHAESFLSFQDYIKKNYGMDVDKSGKDVSRACYASFDESVFLNPEARLFTVEVDEVDEETGEVTTRPRTQPPNKPSFVPDPLKHLELVVSRIEELRIDLTADYDDWMLIAFCMATYGEAGSDYFHRISAFNSGYSVAGCNDKFKDARNTTRFTTPAWFFKHCKKFGIDIEFPKGSQPVPAAKKTVAKAEKPTRIDDEPQDKTGTFKWPSNVTFDSPEIQKQAEKDVHNHGHFSHKWGIYFSKYSEGEFSFSRKTNFTITPYYIVTDEEGMASRILTFTNFRGEKRLERVPTDAFTSISEFSKFIERGNFHHSMTKTDFTRIKGKVYDECKPAKEISTLGLHDAGFYCFANGIYADGQFQKIDEHGVVTYKGVHYFLPALSAMYVEQKMKFQFERQFIYVERKVSFMEWSELFCKVYGENGRIGLMFYVMSVFSDIIFMKENAFPILFLYGKPDSGKTAMGTSIISMYHPTRNVSVGSNINSVKIPALARQFSQVNNGVVLVEEYHNELEKTTMEILKSWWNRAPYTKTDTSASNTSSRTVGIPVKSCCVMTAQHLPNLDVGFFTRCILLSFFKKDSYTPEEMSQFDDLKTMQEDSLTIVTSRILNLRGKMVDKFNTEFAKEKRFYGSIFTGPNVNRIGIHCSHIMATFSCLNGELKFPFSYDELKETLMKVVDAQMNMMASSDESSTFWDIVQSLVYSNQIQDGHDYDFRTLSSISIKKTEGKGEHLAQFSGQKELLFIRLSRLHGLYLKEMRVQGRKGGMDKTSLINYLKNSQSYIGTKDNFRFKDGPTSAFVFDYDDLSASGFTMKKEDSAVSSDTELQVVTNEGEVLPEPGKPAQEGDLPF